MGTLLDLDFNVIVSKGKQPAHLNQLGGRNSIDTKKVGGEGV